MFPWQTIVRWIHILAGAAWLGEVITISFVLVPSLSHMDLDTRRRTIARIFPLIFRLASVLSLITISAGFALNYAITSWQRLDLYIASPRGAATSTGALLGVALTGIHFFVENRIEGRVGEMAAAGEADLASITRYLRIVPRIGLGVLITIFILMMIGARGF